MSGAAIGPLLAIDTATSQTVVAVERADGSQAQASWPSGQRHGEELLAGLDRLLAAEAIGLASIQAIVVGTGPGGFTGLRVGLATAKGLAHALAIPIVGIPTSTALLAAADAASKAGRQAASQAAGDLSPGGSAVPLSALLLPAGPRDRVLVDQAGPRLLPAGTEPELAPAVWVVAVDLEGRASSEAVERGIAALAGLGPSLLRLGRARLARGEVDDLARLVPEYVSLPRGVTASGGTIEWSRDPR
jgi:tRNA threonylcarbamoyl adenosine modification protein YeaZ